MTPRGSVNKLRQTLHMLQSKETRLGGPVGYAFLEGGNAI